MKYIKYTPYVSYEEIKENSTYERAITIIKNLDGYEEIKFYENSNYYHDYYNAKDKCESYTSIELLTLEDIEKGRDGELIFAVDYELL